MAFLSDGNRISTWRGSDTVQMWDYRTGVDEPVLEEHSSAVQILFNSTCGRWIATCDKDWTIRLWDLRDTKQQYVLVGGHGGFDNWIFDLKFSPTGYQFAVCSEDGRIWLFDPEARPLLTSKKLRELAILAWDYSPNGQQLALGTLCSIDLWDLQSDEPSLELSVFATSMQSNVDSLTIA